MSFVGIFRAKNGLAALVDSKASIMENGRLVEETDRHPEKMFCFDHGLAVTYGANQIFLDNQTRVFSNRVNIEDLVRDYLASKNNLDSAFFQSLLLKISSSPANKDPVHFIVGRKIWDGNFSLEHHQIGCNYYVEKLAGPKDHFFTGGDELYKKAFDRMDLVSKITDVDLVRKTVAARLMDLIQFYDGILSYNSVGGPVRSYVLK